MSPAFEVGQQLVSLCKEGKFEEAMEALYSDSIVSIEGQGDAEMPARMEGIEAVRKKSEWWYANNEVHSVETEGPYCGHRDDQFIARFVMDITPKDGERSQFTEVGLYTVSDGKIVQEEFLYLMG